MTTVAEYAGPAPAAPVRPRPYRRVERPAAPALERGGGSHRAAANRPRRWTWLAFLVLLGVASFALHVWRVRTASDLFIDEPFYTQVGQSMADGGMPWATGSYFFLHPPGFFLLEAGWIRIFGSHPYDVWAQVFSIRKLIAVLAALSTVLVAVIVNKLAGRRAAAIAALVFVASAFINVQTGIVILEPATLFWALVGYALLVHLARPGSGARSWQLTGAGLAFGLCNLTKEFGIFVTVVPVVLILAFQVIMTRREAVGVLVFATLPWAVWTGLVAATGHWDQFATQISSGYHRTTGATQISGFNQPGAPTFLSAILQNLDMLWTAYVVLGLGTLAIVRLLFSRRVDRTRRVVAFFGAGAIPLLAYSVTLGTNEEQFFNFLFYPALICLVVVVAREWHRFASWLRVGLIALLTAGLVSDAAVYLNTRLTHNDGTHQIDSWMAQHVRPGTGVEVTNAVQREIFLRYNMIDAAPNKPLDAAARYFVVFYAQVDKGYAFVDRATVDRNTKDLRTVFATSDRGNGRMVIYARG